MVTCEELLLSLDVLSSTSIKRKKSWSKIIWLGQEEAESLILLDPQRISLLYLPQGRTQKNIPNVSPLVAESLDVNTSINGVYLVGLMQDGGIFLWKKHADTLWLIQGLCQYIDDWETNQDSYSVFVSNDATKILVVTSTGHVYVWLLSMSQTEHHSKQLTLDGCWYPVDVPIKFRALFKESDHFSLIPCTFFSNQVLGCCCNCSFMVYTKKNLIIITLHLNFLTAALSPSSSFYPFVSDWMSIEYDHLLRSDTRGPPVAAYAHNGQILAMAINMSSPSLNKILFLSPFTNTSVMSSVKSCDDDTSQSIHASYYWIADMAWTYDDLFLACILRSGSVCIMPRLGAPILLQTSGHSTEMGPSYFLPLHPVIIISGITEPPTDQAESNQPKSPNAQKFSVSTHPHLPIIIYSDGFLVTVLKISHEVNFFSLVCDVVLKSSRQLSHINREYSLDLSQTTVSQCLQNPEYRTNKDSCHTSQHSFKFEEPGTSLCSSKDSELSTVENDAIPNNIKDGKIIFGVTHPERIQPVCGDDRQRSNPEVLKSAYSNLLMAWKLQVTSGCVWSSSQEKAIKQTLQNMIKLFTILLDVPEMSEHFDSPRHSGNSGLFCLIRIFREFLSLLHFDFLFQRFVNVIATFVHKTIKLILSNKKLSESDPPLKTLLGCEALLQFSSQSIKKVYTWSPKYLPSVADISGETESEDNSWYEPMKKNEKKPDITIGNSPKDNFSSQKLFCLHELLPTWSLLMKHAKMKAVEIRNITSGENKGLHGGSDENEHMQILMQLFQRLNTRLFSRSSSMQDIKKKPRRISKGDRYSLESMHTLAEDAWKEELVKIKGSCDPKVKCDLLHSLLYTYLLRGQLAKAMEMVEALVLKGDVSAATADDFNFSADSSTPLFFTVINSSQSAKDQKVPCIKDVAIRQVVQSLARFMALYFCNKQLFIFPPNLPLPIPVLYKAELPNFNERIIPKYQQDITSVITSSCLGNIWTVDRCMEYLLLSGLVPEAAWFSEKIGDWKAALTISTAYLKHRAVFPDIYAIETSELVLPDHLRPFTILQKELTTLLCLENGSESVGIEQKPTKGIFDVPDENCFRQLTTTLTSVFTAGILCDVDVASWLFPALVDSLKELVQNFSANVPAEFHLPAPPYFLWQPTDTSQLGSTEIKNPFLKEKENRQNASILVRLILAVLQSSKLALPVVRWYVLQLRKINKKASGKFEADFDGPVTQLPDFLEDLGQTKCILKGFSSRHEVMSVLDSFRCFCALLWFLHVRDNLSNHNRQRRAFVENHSIEISTDPDDHWLELCRQNLIWVIHFLPFSRFLQEEKWPYKVLLSLLAEIPASVHTAQILATHCYNADQLDPEVQETLDVLLKRWQTILVWSTRNSVDSRQESGFLEEDSLRKKSLSVYFQEYCCTVQDILKQKKKFFGKYTEFLFEGENSEYEDFVVGSYPFETSDSFIKFLDMFFDVSFLNLKQIEEETQSSSQHSVPLIKPFSEKIEKLQMESMPFRTTTGRHPKQNLLILSSPCRKTASQRNQNPESPFICRSRSMDQALPTRSKGLFKRSQSADSHRTNQMHSSTPLSAPEKRQIWIASKTKPIEAASSSVQPRSSESLSEKNERTLWSFDGQFGPQYVPLNQFVDWMIIWARKNEVLFSQLDKNSNRTIKPAIHVEIQPQLLILALWLIQEKYHSHLPADSHLASETFSQHQTEVIVKKKTDERRNVLEMDNSKISSTCSSKEESSEISTPSVGKNQLKKWLRDKLIHAHHEVEEDAEQISFQTLSKKSLKLLPKSLRKKSKKKRSQTTWDSLKSPDDERMKLAYKEILQTIEEFSSASEDVTNLTDLGVPERPKTEISSTLLSTNNSVSLSHLTDSVTLTDSVLSEITKLSESVDDSFKTQPASQVSKIKRRKRPTPNSLKSDTMSTTKEMEQSIIDISGSAQSNNRAEADFQECNIHQILQEEVQNMITKQNERLMSVMGAMLNTDHNYKRQSRKNDTSKNGAELEKQGLRDKAFSSHSSNHSDQRSIEKSVHLMPKSEKSSQTTFCGIDNILKELENLQLDTNVKGGMKISAKNLKANQKSRNKISTKENDNDYMEESISQDIILERESHIPKKNQEQIYLLSNDNSSKRYHLTEIESIPKQSFLPFPQLNFAPVNNESQPLGGIPGCIKIPLLSLNREHSVSKQNETTTIRPKIQAFDYQFHHLWNLPGTNHPVSQNVTHKNFMNRHNMINSHQHQLPDKNHSNFPQFNQKQQMTSQGQAPLPLLQIPKENFAPSWRNLEIRLIAPELIADFKCRLLEKDLKKQQDFKSFQQNQLKKLEEKERESRVQNVAMPLLVAQLDRKESASNPEEFAKVPETSPSKDESTVNSEKRMKEKVGQDSKQEVEDRQEEPSMSMESVKSESVKPNIHQKKVFNEKPDVSEELATPQIDHGFITKPGAFENYLKLGAKLGLPTENYANIQHDLATRLQRLRHESKKVDFSTMTKELCDASMETDPAMEEQARTAEAATSITKDTGCDPVMEAMMAYNRVVQGSFLPPDIYFKLHSKDSEEEHKNGMVDKSAKEQEESTKYSFLNVVDIPCSAVMSEQAPISAINEIIKPKVTAPLESLMLPSEPAREETQSTPVHPEVNQSVTQAWGDKNTIAAKDSSKRTFTQLHESSSLNSADIPDSFPDVISPSVPSINDKSVGLLKSSPRLKKKKEPVRFEILETFSKSKSLQESSKNSLFRELKNMDQQIALMDQLALKMEEEYHRTKLFSHRMDTMIALEPGLGGTPVQSETVNPEKSSQVSKLSSNPYHSKPPLAKSQTTRWAVPSASSNKKPDKRAGQKKPLKIPVSESKNTMFTPHLSTQPPTQQSSSETDQIENQDIEKLMDISDLNGVSDIIADLIGKGDINLMDFGLRPEEIDQLTDKIVTRSVNGRHTMQMSLDKLSQMARESEANNNNNGQESQERNRTNQNNQDYLYRQEMRAQEKQPLHRRQQPMPNGKIEKDLRSRQESREERQQENWGRRIAEAEKLIVSFKLDQEEAKVRITPPASPSNTKKSTNVSPRRKKTASQVSPKPPLQETNFKSTGIINQYSSLFLEQQEAEDFDPAEMRNLELESAEHDFMDYEHPRSNIPQPTSQLTDTSVPIRTYTVNYSPPSQKVKETNPAKRPFQTIVRLQRPEVTRKALGTDQKSYVERLKEITKKNLQSPRSGDKQKLYGTKKIPTGQAENSTVVHREVKSYSERLQEIRRCAKWDESTPIVPQHLYKPPNATSKPMAKMSSTSRKISQRQPVPYVERLRQLSNKGTYTRQDHLPTRTVTLKQAPIQRRRMGPLHKPKTYVQQLQAVNAAAKLAQDSALHTSKITKERTTNRQHPYASPYNFSDCLSVTDADSFSDISEWTLDGRIKDMLYRSQEQIDDVPVRNMSESGSDYYDEVLFNSENPVRSVHASSSEDVSSHIDWVALERGLAEEMKNTDPLLSV